MDKQRTVTTTGISVQGMPVVVVSNYCTNPMVPISNYLQGTGTVQTGHIFKPKIHMSTITTLGNSACLFNNKENDAGQSCSTQKKRPIQQADCSYIGVVDDQFGENDVLYDSSKLPLAGKYPASKRPCLNRIGRSSDVLRDITSAIQPPPLLVQFYDDIQTQLSQQGIQSVGQEGCKQLGAAHEHTPSTLDTYNRVLYDYMTPSFQDIAANPFVTSTQDSLDSLQYMVQMLDNASIANQDQLQVEGQPCQHTPIVNQGEIKRPIAQQSVHATRYSQLFRRSLSTGSLPQASHPSQLGYFERILNNSQSQDNTPVFQDNVYIENPNLPLRRVSSLSQLQNNLNNQDFVQVSQITEIAEQQNNGNIGNTNNARGIAPNNIHGEPIQQAFPKTCTFCQASLMAWETNGVCCNQGKKIIAQMPDFPLELIELYNTPGFSAFSRQLNNMLAMTAIGVKSRNPGTGFNTIPGLHNISFKGKIYHRALPLSEPGPLHWLIVDPASEPTGSLTMQQQQWLGIIKSFLRTNNPYVRAFLQMADGQIHADAVSIEFKDKSPDESGEIVVLYCNEEDNAAPPDRYAIVFPRRPQQLSVWQDLVGQDGQANTVQQVDIQQPSSISGSFVSIYLPQYDRFGYPLLHPMGDSGWGKIFDTRLPGGGQAPLSRPDQNGQARQLTLHDYLKQIQYRGEQFHCAGRLFNEYLCDGMSKIEDLRINYVKNNVNRRVAAVGEVVSDGEGLPGRQILPESFVGSPRYQRQLMQDGLAIVRTYGKPAFFITMTCNPQWPEIQAALKNGQHAMDRPDIVNRVFKRKLDQLLEMLKQGRVFTMPGRSLGQDKTEYWMCVIEFQFRGLPHAHITVRFLGPQPVTAANVDACVSAEMPDENSIDNDELILHALVKRFMVHQCRSKCKREDGSCKYGYPKQQKMDTTIGDRGFTDYMRRGTTSNPTRDARVVPYNRKLLLFFRCHINVEVAASVEILAYLYKYIYKGPDLAYIRFRTHQNDQPVDEVKEYVCCRGMGASEASWRTFGYQINRHFPSVTRVNVHLPGQMPVYYDSRVETAQQALDRRSCPIEGYFSRATTIGTQVANMTYMQFYACYYNGAPANQPIRWVRRRQRHVSRFHYSLTPRSGEIFYLQQLLKHVPACCWEDLRTHNGVLYSTFREAAISRALVSEGNEPHLCMQIAVENLEAPYALISLFVTLVRDGAVPLDLYQHFRLEMGLQYHLDLGGTRGPTLLPAAENRLLRELFDRLRIVGIDPLDTRLPVPTGDHNELLRAQQLIADRHDDDLAIVDDQVGRLTSEQVSIYNLVDTAIESHEGVHIFIDAPSGRGKSYLLSTIASRIRSLGKVVLVCASTGIASLDYVDGVTAHSLFKIPIQLNASRNVRQSQRVCGVGANTQRAVLIRAATAIIWDEVAMTHRKDFDSVNRLLQDICDTPGVPFGGKIFLCAGDFRQIAPVVKNGNKIDTIQASLKTCVTFAHLQRMPLTVPMRDAGDPIWSTFVDEIGNGTTTADLAADGSYGIQLPQGVRVFTSQQEAIQWVQSDCLPERLPHRAMLSYTNGAVDELNGISLQMHAGECVTLQGINSMEDDGLHDAMQEMLDGAVGDNVPPTELHIKTGMVCMLIRNLDPKSKLMNGSKVKILDIYNGRLIKVYVYHSGQEALIPRIGFKFTPQGTQYEVLRQQFPLRLATAKTVNKSQGQTLDRVVLDLRSQAFAHGQLYVAVGRVKRKQDFAVLTCSNSQLENQTGPSPSDIVVKNVIYRQLLS